MTNEVSLQGRLSREPEEKVLPSGDRVWLLRVVVQRPPGARPGVDWVDCAAWRSRLRQRVAGWHAGDVVAVEGALRRRFYRSGGGPTSTVEVELSGGRLIRRAPAA